MRPLLLVLLAAPLVSAAPSPVPVAPAAPPAPVAAPATAAPAAPTAKTSTREQVDVGLEATAPNGLIVRADLRDEYLQGLPLLVELTIRNDASDSKVMPDLAQRRHLVHFKLVDPSGKDTERFSTPPAFDTGGEWTIAPRGRRTVLFEVPSSTNLTPGTWKLTVMVGETGNHVDLPTQTLVIAPPKPLATPAIWEPLVDRNSGAIVPWVHQAQYGFDLYLNQYAVADASKLLAHYRLLRSPAAFTPVLSHSQPSAARSRWIYWLAGKNEVRAARLEGSRISGAVRSFGAPWPTIELLARGVSDAKGGLLAPIWIPAPKGTGGSIRVLCMDERGGVVFRTVADFPTKPSLIQTGIDSSSSLTLIVGHEKGLDVYRVDPTWPAELPAAGERAWKPEGGWTTAAAAFDSLPDSGSRAGGLAILALQLLPAIGEVPAQMRTLRMDLRGKVFETSPASAWTAPTAVTELLPNAYAPFRYTAKDSAGATWSGVAGTAPVSLGKLPEARLWPASPTSWRLRWLAGERILSEKAIP